MRCASRCRTPASASRSAAARRIFQPYEQVDGSIARRFGGTGLGLAICAELAERMHGRIGVLSEEGAGSLFWVELPLAVAAEQSPRPAVSLVG